MVNGNTTKASKTGTPPPPLASSRAILEGVGPAVETILRLRRVWQDSTKHHRHATTRAYLYAKHSKQFLYTPRGLHSLQQSRCTP